MGIPMRQFTGHLMTFDKKGDGDEIIDEDVLIEVTDFNAGAEIEIAFSDRNEKCYLRIPLAELMRHLGAHAGEKESA
jgi:hypothetical protein